MFIAVNETPSQGYGCHLPYGITQCYLLATRHNWTRTA